MAVSINWATKEITVPKADLTQPGASTTFFTYDTDAGFWEDVKAAEASETGIVFDDLVDRNAPYTIGGVTYAPKVEVLPPANVTFEDADYTVALQGSNNNIFDKENGVLNKNNVLIIPGNSAGLQIVETAVSGLTSTESQDLTDVRDSLLGPQRLAEGSTGNFQIWRKGQDPDVDPPAFTQDVTDKDGLPLSLPGRIPGTAFRRLDLMPIVTRGLGGFALTTRGLGPLILIYVTSKGYVVDTDALVGGLDDTLTLDDQLTLSTSSQNAAVQDALFAELQTILDGDHVYTTLSTPYAVAVSTSPIGLLRIFDALAEIAEVTVTGTPLTTATSTTEATVTDSTPTTLEDGDI